MYHTGQAIFAIKGQCHDCFMHVFSFLKYSTRATCQQAKTVTRINVFAKKFHYKVLNSRVRDYADTVLVFSMTTRTLCQRTQWLRRHENLSKPFCLLIFFSSFKPKGRTSRDTVPLTCAVCPALAISSITGIIPKLYYTEVVIYIMHVNSMGRTKQSWPMLYIYNTYTVLYCCCYIYNIYEDGV